MGRAQKQPRCKPYSATALEQCLKEIRNKVPINTACRRYEIPRSTVKFRLSEKWKQQIRTGPPTVLSAAEETKLVEWIKTMARKGFPVTKHRLVNVVTTYLDKNPGRNTFKNKKPTTQWIRSFLARHKELSIRTPESVTNASANVTELDIRRWHKEVTGSLEEEGFSEILQDPRRVLNGDEACFYLDPTADKVIAHRGDRNVYKVDQGPAKKNITVMFTCAADGKMFPPMVIVPYQKIPQEVTRSVPPDWGLAKTDNGWMQTFCFWYYIKKILHPQLQKENLLPAIYFVDGHSSHTAWEVAEECRKLGIILVCLYPNCTRILQPLDVAVFKPMKVAWLKTVEEWKSANPNQYLKSEHFAPLLKTAMEAVKPETIINGFEACGLFPWDEDGIDYSKCIAKATSTSPVEEVVRIIPQALKLDSGQRATFPIICSEADEILKMLGKDRISRYNQIEPDLTSDDDKILYHVFKMLLPLTMRAAVTDEESCEASYAQEETGEVESTAPDQSDSWMSTEDEELQLSSKREIQNEDYDDAQDIHNYEPMNIDLLPDLTDMKLDSRNEETEADQSELSSILAMQTPRTPHRKGTHRFKHRSPAVLTSRQRLDYHRQKAVQKAKLEEDKKRKAERKAEQKAMIEEEKQRKAELKAQKKTEMEAAKKAKDELRKIKKKKIV